MKIRKLVCCTILLACFWTLRGQDSLEIFFLHKSFNFKENDKLFHLRNDTLYSETIVEIGNHRFFYLKERVKDSITVEAGQLNSYQIGGKTYLLRQGYWILENDSKKGLFNNLGEKGILEEFQIDPEPTIYPGIHTPQKKIKKSSTKKTK